MTNCFWFWLQVIEQLTFRKDFIEINNRKVLKLSSRQFIRTPHEQFIEGKVVPRLYVDYDLTLQSGDGRYFRTSVVNSFPDKLARIAFLNKFYQCLLYGQLPHKATKLVTVGKSNSGKTSWAKLFYGLLGKSKVITISKEKIFGLANLEEETELIFVDEWAEETISAENAKILLQGSYLFFSNYL